MTNEKLGVLLVDVPEPSMWKYYYVTDWSFSRHTSTKETRFDVQSSDSKATVRNEAYKCTQEEAKKYPQFRWVALEDL
ncbi:hypothetical protein [Streptococcus suis]|uniref:hypothetical protein n=1 Tax=Streptococcus suis TaxID=1307 RepID=UPI000CF50BEA|nr:hypothetical protein [Streptococcus suis]